MTASGGGGGGLRLFSVCAPEHRRWAVPQSGAVSPTKRRRFGCRPVAFDGPVMTRRWPWAVDLELPPDGMAVVVLPQRLCSVALPLPPWPQWNGVISGVHCEAMPRGPFG